MHKALDSKLEKAFDDMARCIGIRGMLDERQEYLGARASDNEM